MKQILVIHTDTKIIGWLSGEPIESASGHIPYYLDYIDVDGNPVQYNETDVQAQVIEVPDSDEFASDKYTITNGEVVAL